MRQCTPTNQAAPMIEVSMFGGFSIQAGEGRLQDTVARTHQLWHLIEYLITFRSKSITQEELIAVLWPEGGIDNPANALKNLVYRVRSLLSSHGLPCAKDMIVYSRGGYRWNNDLPCRVDAEEFDRLFHLADSDALTPEQRVPYYRRLIDLYKGNFLPGARFETWVAPLSSRYRARYYQCVYALLDHLQEQRDFAAMEEICLRAIAIDQFEEPAHRYYIIALIGQGKQALGMSHYSSVTDLFFRELGISPSSSMRELYREIAKTSHDVEIDLGIVKQDLEESDHTDGAFYCEYEVFKNLYRLEARTAARTGQSVFISLVTAEALDGSAMDVKLQNKVMDSLFEIIQGSLRKGDVYARFSACQYVLMLPALTFENCEMVMDRIIKRFRHIHRNRNVAVFCKTLPLDPIERA